MARYLKPAKIQNHGSVIIDIQSFDIKLSEPIYRIGHKFVFVVVILEMILYIKHVYVKWYTYYKCLMWK